MKKRNDLTETTQIANLLNDPRFLFNAEVHEIIREVEIAGMHVDLPLICAANISKSSFKNCTFQNVVFYSTNIVDCNFINCKFINCEFKFGEIANSNFRYCTFENCATTNCNQKNIKLFWSSTDQLTLDQMFKNDSILCNSFNVDQASENTKLLTTQ